MRVETEMKGLGLCIVLTWSGAVWAQETTSHDTDPNEAEPSAADPNVESSDEDGTSSQLLTAPPIRETPVSDSGQTGRTSMILWRSRARPSGSPWMERFSWTEKKCPNEVEFSHRSQTAVRTGSELATGVGIWRRPECFRISGRCSV